MPQKPNYSRGDVVLVLFPHSSLRAAKTRPAVVVQANGLSTGLPQVIVAMITSQMSRAGHRSRVTVKRDSKDGLQSGLLTDSVVMTDNIATIADQGIYRIIGRLLMSSINLALKHTLDL
jgi:mRNA interferase MazF